MSGNHQKEHYKLAQKPNPPVTVALVGVVFRLIAEPGEPLFQLGTAALAMGLTVWAYLEATEGVNRFRKALGVAGLFLVAYLLFQASYA